jgi:DNA polymerase-1
VDYTTVDTLQALARMVARARKARHIAVDTETVIEPGSPQKVDALRSVLVGISIATAPGEAYYLPLRHRRWEPAQGDLLTGAAGGDADRAPTDAPQPAAAEGDEPAPEGAAAKKKPAKKKAAASSSAAPASIAARMLAEGAPPVRNLPDILSPEMEPLRALLEDPAVKKTAQNAKYDVLTLRRAGVTLHGLDFDTMLASYVLDPGRRSHGLDVLALEFAGHQMTSYEELCGRGRAQLPFDVVPVEAARDYSCEDADVTLQLRAVFEPQLETHELSALLRDFEVPLVDVLAEMEWNGIAIDVPVVPIAQGAVRARAQARRAGDLRRGGARSSTSTPTRSSLDPLRQAQAPARKRTATGPEHRRERAHRAGRRGLRDPADAHGVPRAVQARGHLHRHAARRCCTRDDQRLHTSFNQTGGEHRAPLVERPEPAEHPDPPRAGRDIRRGFVPRKGWKLLAADYSQIELRLLAHLSRDPAFVEAFNAGGDIHRQTAAIIFGVPLDLVTSEMRGRAKTINFATIYGIGAHALSRQLKISRAEAADFITKYFERFSGIKQYLDSRVEFAREHGYAETIFKRRRFIPELRERNFNIRAFGERTAANSPIQGSAADLIKVAMIRIERGLRGASLNTKMLLQVHDELVFEVPPPELDAVTELVTREMEHAVQLSVPLVVETGVGGELAGDQDVTYSARGVLHLARERRGMRRSGRRRRPRVACRKP